MRLAELLPTLAPLAPLSPADSGEREVRGVSRDSRTVGENDLFIAIRGERFDGRRAAPGLRCAAVVADGPVETAPGVPAIQVADARRALASVAAALHGHPARRLPTVGLTGTNGKTTTAWMLESVARAAGQSSLVVGTTGHRLAGRALPASHTTPEAPVLHGLLAQALDAGCGAAFLEVSSIGIALERVHALPFRVAAWTSFSRDHLDHHGSMAAYHAEKARLFHELLAPDGIAVLNADDPAIDIVAPARSTLRYGRSPGAAVRLLDAVLDLSGARAQLEVFGRPAELVLPLLGRHNLENALCALSVGLALGWSLDDCLGGLASVSPVPGRCEPVPHPGGPLVLVDYAHTPDALERVLGTLRSLSNTGELSVVFGCGGDRDRTKRAPMGAIAAAGADRVIVTSDNPRSEDPQAIIDAVLVGCPGAEALVDRAAAIDAAVAAAGPADVVLVAGKGHEQTQTLADRTVPFDDRAVAAAALARHHGG